MLLYLYLRQEKDGDNYLDLPLDVDKEVKFGQLQKRITQEWEIKLEHQQLFLVDKNNDKLLHSLFKTDPELTLSAVGLEHLNEIVVVHRLFEDWKFYKAQYDDFKSEQYVKQRNDIWIRAQALIKKLNDSRFILTYQLFAKEFQAMNTFFSKATDRELEAIRDSAEQYFLKKFPGAILHFGEKTEGTRRGLICDVTTNISTIKYFIKTNHDGGDKDSHGRGNIDLIELFVYKVLEKLGVGAEVYFITNACNSRWIIYLASKEIPKFKTLSEIEQKEDDLTRFREVVFEMLVVFSVLELGDNHNDNIGFDNNGKPFIVDFHPKPVKGSFNITDSNHFHPKLVGHPSKFSSILETLTHAKKVDIAKKFLSKLPFKEVVDNIFISFCENQKKLFDEKDLVFEFQEKKTDNLKEYVKKIKENYASIIGEN